MAWYDDPSAYFGVSPNTYNAKTLPYSTPGIGAANYGINLGNVMSSFEKLYGERSQKKGGSKAIYDAASKYAGNQGYSDVADALRTGNFADVDPTRALDVYDFGLRETTRAQQNKGGGFLDSLTGILKSVAPAVAGSLLLPGIGSALGATISAPVGGAVGGALAGGIQDGWKGAALGGLQGYGVGKFTDAASGWMSRLATPSPAPWTTAPAGGFGATNPFMPEAAGDLWNAGGAYASGTAWAPQVSGNFPGWAPDAARFSDDVLWSGKSLVPSLNAPSGSSGAVGQGLDAINGLLPFLSGGQPSDQQSSQPSAMTTTPQSVSSPGAGAPAGSPDNYEVLANSTTGSGSLRGNTNPGDYFNILRTVQALYA